MDISKGYSTKWVEVEETKIKIQHIDIALQKELEDKFTIKGKLDGVAHMEALIDHVIVDWVDVKSNGKIIKCNLQNKKKMAIDTKHPGRVEKLLLMAILPQTFHPTAAEIVGNLTRPSNISGNGKEKEAEIAVG